MPYVSLHTHSEHSALDSTAKISQMFERVAEMGQTSLAVTDHGTLGGLWRAQAAANSAGVKLVPGCEIYLAYGDRFSPESLAVVEDGIEKTKRYMHLTLLATNAAGWLNLVAINNASQISKSGKFPLADLQLITAHGEGLLILTGCLGGPVLGPLSRGDHDEAETNLLALIAAVGRENVYVEIMEHGIPSETAALPAAAALATKHGLKMVATNDSHHVHADGAAAQEAWLAVATQTTLADPKRYKFHGTGFHLRTEAEMLALRPEPWWAAAVHETSAVADRITDRVLPSPTAQLPKFPTPAGFADNHAFFQHLVLNGAEKRYGNLTERPDVVARLVWESEVVGDAGFEDYFLIVHELISWSRSQGILVGPGRGSAAGSCIAYVLEIVGIDPLENNLLFERFMEPGRIDWPDIDVDFEALRRMEVLDHLRELWGAENISLIGAFSRAASKRALQDAARVLDAGDIGRRLSAAVPVEGGVAYTFEQLADTTDLSTGEYQSILAVGGAVAGTVAALAAELSGTVNGSSIHACGVIVSDRNLREIIPQRLDNETGAWISQWDSRDIEAFGLLKLDVLALRNLDVANQAITFIAETTGEVLDFDNLPHPNAVGDPRVTAAWALLRDGRTAGVFQMESSSMTSLARQVCPDNLTDLSAVIALFRPGPLSAGMDQHFANRKNGLEEIDYRLYSDHPAEQTLIAGVLGTTYGAFVFQEQLMTLSGVMAGFNVAQRGALRKAVSKKDKAKMEAVGELFRGGCIVETVDDNGTVTSPAFDPETASRVWDQMKGCGAYLFNASHSAAYAQLAFTTAFLKANWPAPYGAAILAVTDSDDKRTLALRSLPLEGVKVLPPDVNLSAVRTRPEGGAVRLGLGEVKTAGLAGELIVAVREATRPFTSLYDVVDRVRKGGLQLSGQEDLSYLPSNQMEALIDAGACDSFGPRMGLAMVSRARADITPPDMEYGALEVAARQRRVLLISLGDHPLKNLQTQLKAFRQTRTVGGVTFEQSAIPISRIPNANGVPVLSIGILGSISEKPYRGGRLASVVLEGTTGSIEAVMWDGTLTAVKASGLPRVGSVVIANARVTVREFETIDSEGNTTVATQRGLTILALSTVDVHDPVILGSVLSAVPRILFPSPPGLGHAKTAPGGTDGAVTAPVTAAAPTLTTVEPTVAVAPAVVVPAVAVPDEDSNPDDDADIAVINLLLGIVPAIVVPVQPTPLFFLEVPVNTPASRACRGRADISDEFRQRLVATGGCIPPFNSHETNAGVLHQVISADRRVLGEVRICRSSPAVRTETA